LSFVKEIVAVVKETLQATTTDYLQLRAMESEKRKKLDSMEDSEELLLNSRKFDIFQVMMLCEQDECLRAENEHDVDIIVSSTKFLPLSSVNFLDRSSSCLSNPVRLCSLDDKVLISLNVLVHGRGILRKLQARDRSKSNTAKIEFIFQECEEDQTDSLLAASNFLKEVSTNFPSLFIRYIPAVLNSLRHSLYLASPDSKTPERRHVDVMQHDSNSGRVTAGKVAFRFLGDDVNSLLWETVCSILHEIPLIILLHPRSAYFGVDYLREEIQQLYSKRQVIISINSINKIYKILTAHLLIPIVGF
jgi:hypothetical protein